MGVIVLDLDHTLFHTVGEEVGDTPLEALHHGYGITYVRPHARKFLTHLIESDMWDVGVWTAGVKEYAWSILPLLLTDEQLSRVKFVLTREHTTALPGGELFKDLRVVQHIMQDTDVLLLDDSHIHASYNPPEQVELVPKFDVYQNGANADDFLLCMIEVDELRQQLCACI